MKYPSAASLRSTNSLPRANVITFYRTIRQATEALCKTLTEEDCVVQSMPNCSPAKWHLAHTSWFFETFVLEREIPSYQAFHPTFRTLFNSYYKTVGEQYPRPQRGLLTRPRLPEILAYRKHVNDAMERVFEKSATLTPEVMRIIELGCHHEQQHQELLLTDIKHLFSGNPLYPAYRDVSAPKQEAAATLQWHNHEEGLQWIGAEGEGFCFDNETPRHRVFLDAYALASRLVTCREYLEFMEDDGYARPEFWLSDGWEAVQHQHWQAPLYWEQHDARTWTLFSLTGQRAINLEEPVGHVSYYEADAYARWAGARLPTEMEWEHAAASIQIAGNFVENNLLHPMPAAVGSHNPEQLFGDLWEWTQSPYSSYPGFQPQSGALGEYNGKFMCNQMVLRGGSCVTPQTHIRATYRNFFPPETRWQFSGIRLAR